MKNIEIIERQEILPDHVTAVDSSEWSRSDILTLIGVIFAGFLGIVSIWLACRVEKIARIGLTTQLLAERNRIERTREGSDEGTELNEIQQNTTT